jgi:serine/threonine protein kinase
VQDNIDKSITNKRKAGNDTAPNKFQTLETVRVKGYGGFGCVGAPATNCNPYFHITVLKGDGSVEDKEPIDKEIDIRDNPEYTTKTLPNKVFKIMLAKDAKPEFEKSKYLLLQGNGLSKYGILECTMGIYNNYHESFTTMKELCPSAFQSDPDEYRPNLDDLTKAWKKTKIRNNDINPKDPLTLMMIIYEDGGVSLFDYITYLSKSEKIYEPMSVKKFLISLKNLFEGVQVFRSNYIMHGDIKLENIVYDETSGVARFIDFGSATSKKKLLQAAQTARTRRAPNIDEEIRQDSPYAHKLTDIQDFFPAIEREDDDPILERWINSIIDKSDYYMLCLELRRFIDWYYPFLNKRPDTYSAYISCLLALYKLLAKACNSYSKEDGSSEIYSLETLIQDYDDLLATLPVYESTSGSSAVHHLTGGYNKKNNQKKRKTNKKKTNKRKTNKRKINKRKTNKRKTNKRKTNKRKTNKRKIKNK